MSWCKVYLWGKDITHLKCFQNSLKSFNLQGGEILAWYVWKYQNTAVIITSYSAAQFCVKPTFDPAVVLLLIPSVPTLSFKVRWEVWNSAFLSMKIASSFQERGIVVTAVGNTLLPQMLSTVYLEPKFCRDLFFIIVTVNQGSVNYFKTR